MKGIAHNNLGFSQPLGESFKRTPKGWELSMLVWAACFLLHSSTFADLNLLDHDQLALHSHLFPESVETRLKTELVHGEWNAFQIHAKTNREIIEIRNQLKFAIPILERWVGGRLPSDALFSVFAFSDEGLWREVLEASGGHKDGLGFLKDRTIGYLVPLESNDFGFELFHELVHVFVSEIRGDRFPLWAEEGMAQHFAWRMSSLYAKREKGIPLRRELPEFSKFMSPRRLMKTRSYPEDPESLREFYISSEMFMKTLLDYFTEEQYSLLWQRLTRKPAGLKGILKQSFYWDQSDWKTFQNRYSSTMKTLEKSE